MKILGCLKFLTGDNAMIYDYFLYIAGYLKRGMKTMGENIGGAQHVAFFMTGLRKESSLLLSKKALSEKEAIDGPLPNSQRR